MASVTYCDKTNNYQIFFMSNIHMFILDKANYYKLLLAFFVNEIFPICTKTASNNKLSR